MKNILLLISLILLAVACRSSRLKSDITIDNAHLPFGTIKIDDNLYFDKTEMTNIDYREFMWWTKWIYGSNSYEFLSTLPDTNVWSQLHLDHAQYDTFYFRHPVYRFYPVVGISYDQAKRYSEWRSDRVMETFLISYGLIPEKTPLNPDSVFTIEKYFTGEFYDIEPNPLFMIYPHYSLPDSITYIKAAVFADSLNKRNYKYCRDKFCADDLLIDCNCLGKKSSDLFYGDLTLSTDCSFCKKDLITHLKGNVREMTNVEGMFYGSSFIDSSKIQNTIYKTDSSLVNAYTGFRNVCEYRKWVE